MSATRALTPDQVAYVKTRAKTIKAFAAELGVAKNTVWKAIHDDYAPPRPYVPPPPDGREWRSVEGYPNYEVSDAGDVRNIRSGRCLRPCVNPSHGYAVVGLSGEGKSTTLRVHRLVAKAFIPNPEDKAEVNHKDLNRTNNAAINLEWTTKRENIDHAIAEGRYSADIICPWQKITAADEEVIRADLTTKPSVLASRYGVTAHHIWRVRTGRTRRASRQERKQGEL